MWILIITLIVGNNSSEIKGFEFISRSRCLEASKTYNDEIKTPAISYVKAICVAK